MARWQRMRLAAGFAASALAAASATAAASSVDLNFSNDSFAVSGGIPVGQLGQDAQAQASAGYIYDGDRRGDHLNFGHVELLASGEVGPGGPVAGIGVRGFLAGRGDGKNGGGAAIGGTLGYHFPQLNQRLGISAYTYYSPSVLSFGNFKHYLEYGADVDYQVIHPAFIYAGWRRIDLPAAGRHDSAAAGFHLGVRVNF